jgi:hypothetical protein
MRFQLPLALLVLPVAACVESGTSDDVTGALEEELGGLTTDDELPMFGAEDAFDAAAIEPDTLEADTLDSDAAIEAMRTSATAETRHVMVLWGRMPADPTANDGRDWSGSLRTSRGALLARRRINFEPATDRVEARDRERPDRIDFRSVTRPFSDGLVLDVIDPDRDNIEPLRLRYESADGTRVHDLDLRELDNGPVVVDVGGGDRIVAVGRRRVDPCNHGFMRGRWHALAPNHGVFLGIVANRAGEPVGHVRGIYGQRRNGEAVVFAKFIARDGAFSGLISGTYEGQRFHGRWITRDGDHGLVAGAFFEGASLRAGAWAARWGETSCNAR